jgi:uncharacterized phosphatase
MRIATLILLFNFSLLGCGDCGDISKEPTGKEQKVNVKRDFYFVRHGQTPWGPDLILDGPQDLELNKTGIQQAEKAGRKLKEVLSSGTNTNSVKIITSSMKRAVQTAQKVAEITHFPIVGQENGLKERYYGDARLVAAGDTRKTPPDAETPEKFKERAMKALYKVLNENRLSSPLIIVSHQKVFECVSEELTGKAGKLSQGGVAHFTALDGKTWQLEILEVN